MADQITILLNAILNSTQSKGEISKQVKQIANEINKTPMQLKVEMNTGVLKQQAIQVNNEYKKMFSGLLSNQEQIDKITAKHLIDQEKLAIADQKQITAIAKKQSGLKELSKETDKSGQSFASAARKMVEWTIVGGAIFGTLRQIKEGITFINDMNKSMTNVAMITGKSSESIVQMTKDYSDLATQLHDTTGNVMDAAEEFLRAGHNQASTIELIRSSTLMSKIAGQDQKETADQLIAITNGFKKSAEETMDVVDKLTTVDNASATSTKELGLALSRTAVSAQLAGSTFETVTSYIATISDVSRKSATSIGESIPELMVA